MSSGVDEGRNCNPGRILCELYAQCIGLGMTHGILLTEEHRFPDRSLFKAAQDVQKWALSLGLALRRRSKLATYQLLFALEPKGGLT